MENGNRKIDYEMGRFIRSLIGKSGFSQERMAEILDVSPRTIGYYCSGERKPAHKKLLLIIKHSGGSCAEDIPF